MYFRGTVMGLLAACAISPEFFQRCLVITSSCTCLNLCDNSFFLAITEWRLSRMPEIDAEPLPEIDCSGPEGCSEEEIVRIGHDFTVPFILRGSIRAKTKKYKMDDVEHWRNQLSKEEDFFVCMERGSRQQACKASEILDWNYNQNRSFKAVSSVGVAYNNPDVLATLENDYITYLYSEHLRKDPEKLGTLGDNHWEKNQVNQNKSMHSLFVSTPGTAEDGASTASALHSAGSTNLFKQISGSKEWILYSPEYNNLLGLIPKQQLGGAYFETTSRSVFVEQKKVPRFHGILQPGDMLYNPPWWAHSVFNRNEIAKDNEETMVVGSPERTVQAKHMMKNGPWNVLNMICIMLKLNFARKFPEEIAFVLRGGFADNRALGGARQFPAYFTGETAVDYDLRQIENQPYDPCEDGDEDCYKPYTGVAEEGLAGVEKSAGAEACEDQDNLTTTTEL